MAYVIDGAALFDEPSGRQAAVTRLALAAQRLEEGAAKGVPVPAATVDAQDLLDPAQAYERLARALEKIKGRYRFSAVVRDGRIRTLRIEGEVSFGDGEVGRLKDVAAGEVALRAAAAAAAAASLAWALREFQGVSLANPEEVAARFLEGTLGCASVGLSVMGAAAGTGPLGAVLGAAAAVVCEGAGILTFIGTHAGKVIPVALLDGWARKRIESLLARAEGLELAGRSVDGRVAKLLLGEEVRKALEPPDLPQPVRVPPHLLPSSPEAVLRSPERLAEALAPKLSLQPIKPLTNAQGVSSARHPPPGQLESPQPVKPLPDQPSGRTAPTAAQAPSAGLEAPQPASPPAVRSEHSAPAPPKGLEGLHPATSSLPALYEAGSLAVTSVPIWRALERVAERVGSLEERGLAETTALRTAEEEGWCCSDVPDESGVRESLRAARKLPSWLRKLLLGGAVKIPVKGSKGAEALMVGGGAALAALIRALEEILS